jgi:hypothetical protein
MKKLILLAFILQSGSAFAFFAPSLDKAQKELDLLYSSQFSKLGFNSELVFTEQKKKEDRPQLFLGLHKKASKMGSSKAHWSYAINKLPNVCKEVLESGKNIPKDYKSKLYPKNRPAFPKKPFYEIVRECSDSLKENPSLIISYNMSLDQIATKIALEEKKHKEQKLASKLAKEKERKHPNYYTYLEWQESLDKLSRSSAFEFICKKENKYNQKLFSVCLRAEHRALNLIKASLENLWASKSGRENMNEILNILDVDFKESMKFVDGKAVPDMVLSKIRFRNSLEKYFKTKGFSVYDAIAVLN